MYSENTAKKKKAGLFDEDRGRFLEICLRFIPLSLFIVFSSVVMKLELYFSFFELHCNTYSTACIFMILIALTQNIFSGQKFYSKTIPGLIISSFVSVEACLLLVLAQYYPIIAVIIAILSIAAFFGIRYFVRQLNAPNRHRILNFDSKCSKVAFRLSAFIAAVALVIPSGMGMYKEYFSYTLTDEQWADFYDWYNSLESEAPTEEADPNAEKLSELSKWDKLDVGDRERLIRIIAEIEKEYLGIGYFDVEVNTEKMPENRLAYYSPFTQDIYINYRYLNETELENAIITILHELHHAYVYYTIETIDFDSPEVQNSFYYESARQWKANSENYISGSLSYDDYYNQPIERDARAHAEMRVHYYMAYAGNAS